MNRPKRSLKWMGRLAMAVSLSLVVFASAAFAQWPERPITLIVPYSAGGGTDATGRVLAKLLQDQLGQPVNVANRPGGNGVVGHMAVSQARPDGYTIGIATTEVASYKPMGLANITPTQSFTPIALYNFDPASVVVPNDSEYTSINDLIDTLKKGTSVRISTGGPLGGSWHSGFALLLLRAGIDPSVPTFVPSQGAAPGLQEMVAGGVDAITCSLPEAKALIDAEEARPLVVLSSKRLSAFPDVPTIEEAAGLVVSGGAWRAVVAPEGVADEIHDKLVAAMKAAVATDEFKSFMQKRGFGPDWAAGDELQSFLTDKEKSLAETLKAVGLTK